MTDDDVRRVSSVEELVNEVGISLVAVHPFKLAAERDGDFVGEVPEQFDIAHQEQVKFAIAPDRLAVRLITEFSIDGVGTAEIDFAAEYEVAEPVELSLEAFQGFVNRVAVMAIWPFVRQASQDLFLRIAQVAVPLPVILPNDFEFGPGDEGDDPEISDRP